MTVDIGKPRRRASELAYSHALKLYSITNFPVDLPNFRRSLHRYICTCIFTRTNVLPRIGNNPMVNKQSLSKGDSEHRSRFRGVLARRAFAKCTTRSLLNVTSILRRCKPIDVALETKGYASSRLEGSSCIYAPRTKP